MKWPIKWPIKGEEPLDSYVEVYLFWTASMVTIMAVGVIVALILKLFGVP